MFPSWRQFQDRLLNQSLELVSHLDLSHSTPRKSDLSLLWRECEDLKAPHPLNPDRISFRALHAILKSDPLSEDCSGWTRTSSNLLKSGLKVLEKLRDKYTQLWQKRTQSLNQFFRQAISIHRATLRSMLEQWRVHKLPRAHQYFTAFYQQKQNLDTTLHHTTSQFQVLLLQLRKKHLKWWMEMEQPHWIQLSDIAEDLGQTDTQDQIAEFIAQVNSMYRNSRLLGHSEADLGLLFRQWIDLVQHTMDHLIGPNVTEYECRTKKVEQDNAIMQTASQYEKWNQLYAQFEKILERKKAEYVHFLQHPDRIEQLIHAKSDLTPQHLESIMHFREDLRQLETQIDQVRQQLQQTQFQHFEHQKSSQHTEIILNWVQMINQSASQWSSICSDEQRMVEPYQKVISQGVDRFHELKSKSISQVRSIFQHFSEIHQYALKQSFSDVNVQLNGLTDHWKSLWYTESAEFKNLFHLLGEIQKNLADQPSELSQRISKQLLAQQGHLMDYVSEMDQYQQIQLEHILWILSREYIYELQNIVAYSGMEDQHELSHPSANMVANIQNLFREI